MKTWIVFGSILTGLAILLGAFGAHALKSRISPEDLAIFETGIRYHIYHSIGLILIGILGFYFPHNLIDIPAKLFLLGISIFSGSLYLLVLTNTRWLGAITPIGGICYMIGWLLLAFNIYRFE
tara:strand:+ start:2909 stop:3277 length:369 start_codon:yes stop_codon:yes gene_type:complete